MKIKNKHQKNTWLKQNESGIYLVDSNDNFIRDANQEEKDYFHNINMMI